MFDRKYRRAMNMKMEKARQYFSELNLEMRIVKRDGKELELSKEVKNNRINVSVRGGRVSGIAGIF
jgi:hypothetical protein